MNAKSFLTHSLDSNLFTYTYTCTHTYAHTRITPHHITVAGFRRLNRARIQLFKGDDHAMKESRIQLRAQIEANRSVPTSGPVFEELVKGLDEAAQMLSHEIVRGDLNEDTGRYGRFLLFVLRVFWVLFLGPVSVI